MREAMRAALRQCAMRKDTQDDERGAMPFYARCAPQSEERCYLVDPPLSLFSSLSLVTPHYFDALHFCLLPFC